MLKEDSPPFTGTRLDDTRTIAPAPKGVVRSTEPEDIVAVISGATITPGPTRRVALGDGVPLNTPLTTEAMVVPSPVPETGRGLVVEIEDGEISEFELIITPEAVWNSEGLGSFTGTLPGEPEAGISIGMDDSIAVGAFAG